MCKSFNSLKKELTERELISYKRIKDIPFLFDFNKFFKYDKYRDSDLDLNDYDSFSKIYQKTLKNAPLFSVDKDDFILMLNIMYEDQYLSYFKQKGNYSEREYYEMDYDEYLDEFGDNGDLDVKDVKDIEEYQASKNFIFDDKESGKLNFNRIKPDLNPKVKYFKATCDRYSYFKENFV